MASQKNKNKSQSKSIWRRKSFLVLLVAFLVVGGVLVTSAVLHMQNTKAIAADRARFEQVDKDLEAVNQNISSEIGLPSKHLKDRNCSQPFQEVGVAPITCRVTSDFYYITENLQQANEINLKI